MPNSKELYINYVTAWDGSPYAGMRAIISSLLGYRMSFKEIAQASGKTVEQIRNVYKFVPAPATNSGTALPDNCSTSNYMGLQAPKCNAGKGCKVCWDIYNSVNGVTTKVTPTIQETTPVKQLYTATFDDILERYRSWIGMTQDINPAPTREDSDYLDGIIISDIHAPFHDEAKFMKMISDNKGHVDVCILAGDGPDFHNYSKYTKYGLHFDIKDEHKAYTAVLAMLSESFPQVIVMPGNHDERTRKKYAAELPPDLYEMILEFHGPNAFDFAELMTKQFANIHVPPPPTHGYAEYRFLYQINDIVIGHPELFSKLACKSVCTFIDWLKKKAEPMGLVQPFNHAVMGHTHQSGKVFYDFGIIGIENGSFCLTPDYDSGAKLTGVPRPTAHGYTRFRTGPDGITDKNDIQFIYVD